LITRGQTSRRVEAVDGPLLMEVMGPAAAGKTTLLRALRSKDDTIRGGLPLGKAEYIRPAIRKLGVFLPLWALHHRRDRWLDRREMRSIARLETWSRALERSTAGDGFVAVFDHGPLYRLARLREFGPALTESEQFERWWRGSLSWWLEALDIVVLLDAPDPVLLQRADGRGHWFLSDDHPRGEKVEFLARYRRSFDQILEEAGHTTTVLRFRSDEKSVDAIAVDVLAAIASRRSASVRGERGRR
jgi:hypothetical protein